MGNNVASMLIESFRKSSQNTTLVSNTSATLPSFTLPEDLPGVAKAWVNFDGQVLVNEQCVIYNKSTNIHTVSCSNIGEYNVVFKPNTFTNGNYLITGSVATNTRFPISAANNFYVKSSGTGVNSGPPSKNGVKIQTLYVPVVSGSADTTGPAFAHRVHLMFYK